MGYIFPLVTIHGMTDGSPLGVTVAVNGTVLEGVRNAIVRYGARSQMMCDIEMDGIFEVVDQPMEPRVVVTNPQTGARCSFIAVGIEMED